jgi:Crp-like helix-turn-helix domain
MGQVVRVADAGGSEPAPGRIPGAALGALSLLALPGGQYRVLLWLLGSQHPGGVIRTTHARIAHDLRMERATVSRAIGALVRTGLVRPGGNGTYRLNAMLAAYATEQEMREAVAAMPAEERLDGADWASRARRAVRHRLPKNPGEESKR